LAPEQHPQKHTTQATLLDADTSWLDFLDILRYPAGFIDLTTELKNVGSIVHRSLTSDTDVCKRTFGALKKN
jgi:hypothetical protein